MTSTAQANAEAARKLPKRTRDAAAAVWRIVHGDMMGRIEALPMSRRPKVFEVHHAVEVARAAFLAALVAGHGLDVCRTAALKAFPDFKKG